MVVVNINEVKNSWLGQPGAYVIAPNPNCHVQPVQYTLLSTLYTERACTYICICVYVRTYIPHSGRFPCGLYFWAICEPCPTQENLSANVRWPPLLAIPNVTVVLRTFSYVTLSLSMVRPVLHVNSLPQPKGPAPLALVRSGMLTRRCVTFTSS
jgi:hypothetical protein